MHTHLYPGARLSHRVTSASQASAPELQTGDMLLIEFADMSMTCADVMKVSENQIWLKVDGYRTRHGTRIAVKSWVIQAADPLHDSRSYRVVRRAGAPIKPPGFPSEKQD